MTSQDLPIDVSDPGETRVPWRPAMSWAMYDFANTIYSAVVATAAIAPHIKDIMGSRRPAYFVIAASLLSCGLCLPFAGELADRRGRSKRYLVILTVLACALCMGMSLTANVWLILSLFFVANFSYEATLAFYDNLLPTVAPRRKMGLVSGIGVGLGYLGVALALPISYAITRHAERAGAPYVLQWVFAAAGAMFLLFSLPLFGWVSEKPPTRRFGASSRSVRLVFRRVMVTLRALPRHRSVMLFLLGNFLCVDSLNTGIFACVPYLTDVFGLEKSQALLWLIPFSCGAFLLGIVGGKLADLFGPRRAFLSAGFCVFAAYTICSLATSFALFIATFVLLGGYGLATIWAAGRKLLVQLVPPGQVGKYFGLYNVGRKLSVIGIITFGILSDLSIPDVSILGHRLNAVGSRLGMAVQVVLLSVGLFLIYKVRADDGQE